MNVWIGSLFVATMYQISQSLKRIQNPGTDIYKMRQHLRCIYCLAFIFSTLFTIGFIVIFIYFSDEQNKMNFYMYMTMIIAYTILPVAYFWTLYEMYSSMKGLPNQKDI